MTRYLIIKKRELKSGWQWRSVFKTKSETIKDIDNLPDTDNKDNEIYKNLDKMMDQVLKNEKRIGNELEKMKKESEMN